MRRLPTLFVAATAALVPGGCSWLPGLADPELRIGPRMYLYRHEGEARMQSVGQTAPENNPAMDVSRFGQLRRDEDYGGVLSLGDGFSGVEAQVQLVEIDDSKTGTLTTNFGAVPAGTEVNSNLEYDEYRLGYLAELYGYELEADEDDSILLQVGAGGELVHRNGDFEIFDPLGVPGQRAEQRIRFRSDVTPYLRARGRATWREFSVQADWAFNPDVHFGGEFDGVMNDVEVVVRYLIETQDISLLAGYRWSQLPMSGVEGDLRFDADFWVEGYVLGIDVLF